MPVGAGIMPPPRPRATVLAPAETAPQPAMGPAAVQLTAGQLTTIQSRVGPLLLHPPGAAGATPMGGSRTSPSRHRLSRPPPIAIPQQQTGQWQDEDEQEDEEDEECEKAVQPAAGSVSTIAISPAPAPLDTAPLAPCAPVAPFAELCPPPRLSAKESDMCILSDSSSDDEGRFRKGRKSVVSRVSIALHDNVVTMMCDNSSPADIHRCCTLPAGGQHRGWRAGSGRRSFHVVDHAPLSLRRASLCLPPMPPLSSPHRRPSAQCVSAKFTDASPMSPRAAMTREHVEAFDEERSAPLRMFRQAVWKQIIATRTARAFGSPTAARRPRGGKAGRPTGSRRGSTVDAKKRKREEQTWRRADALLSAVSLFAALWCVWWVPYRLVYEPTLPHGWGPVEVVLDVLQLFCFLTNFVRPYRESGIMIYRVRHIAHRYVRRRAFPFAAAAAFPSGTLSWLFFSGAASPLILKLAAAPTISNLFVHVLNQAGIFINPQLERVGGVVAIAVLAIHCVSCGWYKVLQVSPTDPSDTGYPVSMVLNDDAAHLLDDSPAMHFTMYLKGVDWATKHLCGYGVGSQWPSGALTWQSDLQTSFHLAVSIFGLGMYTCFLSTVSMYLTIKLTQSVKARLALKLDELADALQRLPREFHNEVREYYLNVFKVVGTIGMSDILNDLPPELLDRVNYHVGRSMLSRVPMFSQVNEPALIDQLMANLVPKVFLPGMEIVSRGDFGEEMFFVHTGELRVCGRHGELLSVLQAGDHYGERALLVAVKRTTSVVTSTAVALSVLTKMAFEAALHDFPHLWNIVRPQQAAKARGAASGLSAAAEAPCPPAQRPVPLPPPQFTSSSEASARVAAGFAGGRAGSDTPQKPAAVGGFAAAAAGKASTAPSDGASPEPPEPDDPPLSPREDEVLSHHSGIPYSDGCRSEHLHGDTADLTSFLFGSPREAARPARSPVMSESSLRSGAGREGGSRAGRGGSQRPPHAGGSARGERVRCAQRRSSVSRLSISSSLSALSAASPTLGCAAGGAGARQHPPCRAPGSPKRVVATKSTPPSATWSVSVQIPQRDSTESPPPRRAERTDPLGTPTASSADKLPVHNGGRGAPPPLPPPPPHPPPAGDPTSAAPPAADGREAAPEEGGGVDGAAPPPPRPQRLPARGAPPSNPLVGPGAPPARDGVWRGGGAKVSPEKKPFPSARPPVHPSAYHAGVLSPRIMVPAPEMADLVERSTPSASSAPSLSPPSRHLKEQRAVG